MNQPHIATIATSTGGHPLPVATALMGVREYARHRGVSHTAVQQAIKAGRITRRPDGKIDVRQADEDWTRNTDQGRPRNSISGDPAHRLRPDGMTVPVGFSAGAAAPAAVPGAPGAVSAAAAAPPAPPASGAPELPEDEPGSYVDSRARREHFNAGMAQLRYLQETGQLVSAQDVAQQAFRRARATRDLLLSLPARLAPLLAAEGDSEECRRILEGGIRRACDALSADPAEPAQEVAAERFELTSPDGR